MDLTVLGSEIGFGVILPRAAWCGSHHRYGTREPWVPSPAMEPQWRLHVLCGFPPGAQALPLQSHSVAVCLLMSAL